VILCGINVFWAKKLWRGYKKARKDQDTIADKYIRNADDAADVAVDTEKDVPLVTTE